MITYLLLLFSCNDPTSSNTAKDTAAEEHSAPTDTAEEASSTDTAQPQTQTEFCGDGELQSDMGEMCDEGESNSNTVPNSCRENCTLPSCGDGIIDDLYEEACDDGNLWSGDGCRSDCSTEEGPFESEPNNTPEQSNPIPDEGIITGGLPDGDMDCFSIDITSEQSIEALQLPNRIESEDSVDELGNPTTEILEFCDSEIALHLYKESDFLTVSYP
ncbi:MAG: hypothetical protein CMK59_15245, partial [Proteobacteria bacterium]|nr:hypothetical protein [Pseudomonadota bacterium]